MKTTFINLFGGPGIGKSTVAAKLFAYFKENEKECEYVSEFAKDIVWSDNFALLKHQYMIAAEQLYRMARLNGKVQYVVSDSPLLLQIPYIDKNMDKMYGIKTREALKSFIAEAAIDKSFHNVNFILPRVYGFKQTGRIEDQELSKKLDEEILITVQKYTDCIILEPENNKPSAWSDYVVSGQTYFHQIISHIENNL